MSTFTYKKIADLALDNSEEKIDIIDFGCGEGKLLDYFPKSKIRNYLGLDVNENSIFKAKKTYKSSNIEFRLINNESYKFETSSKVDAVVAIGVLQYLTDSQIRYYLKESKRVLKKGGVVVVSCAVDHLPYRLFNLYGFFLRNRYIKRDWLIKEFQKLGYEIAFQQERGLILTPLFSHNIVLLFDALDKLIFRTKGVIGPVGKLARKLFAPLGFLESLVPIDYGYTLYTSVIKIKL